MKIGRFHFKNPFASNPDADKDDGYNDPPKPFMEHLMELRDCVIKCAVAWVVCEVVMIPFAPRVLAWLKAPAGASASMVQGLGWTAGVEIILQIMLWAGTALSLPFLTYFVMKFIFPGLKRSERSLILFCLVTSTVLFAGGVWMAYAATLRAAIAILQQINTWMGLPNNIVQVNEHVTFSLKIIIAFGLAFQLPLLLLVMGWLGIISSKTLKKQRRLAIVIIFTLAMILTPPDPASQIIMAIPMCFLYELCIWLIWLKEKARGEVEDDTDKKEKEEPSK